MDSPPQLVAVHRESMQRSFSEFDALVVVSHAPFGTTVRDLGLPDAIVAAMSESLSVDAAASAGACAPAVLRVEPAPGHRVVFASTSALSDEVDDVRVVAEAVAAAVARAVSAGSRRPLVCVGSPRDARFRRVQDVAALAALGSQWSSLESREAGRAAPTATKIGFVGIDPGSVARVEAMEEGRWLCRDIGGTEPERMTPLRTAELCRREFEGTGVKVTVVDDVTEWPLIAAVARASMAVDRHRPCVIRAEYTPTGPVKRTLLLAGKGVTYDTGGADLKTDGAMAGMSRDKGGAAAVAGLLRTVAMLKLPDVRVVGLLGMVRNSAGHDAYVSDEIVRARSGVRVRIGNTDAEGRLVLADLLATLREESSTTPEPALFSVATLTGHVHRAFGPYVGALENGASRTRGLLAALARAGDDWGEPIEWTVPRREDYAFVAARSTAEDVVSSNRLASVATPRGHQGPFAFLDVTSGIRGTGVPFIHLDISGAALSPPDWQFGRPTGTPIPTLTAFALRDADLT